MKGWVGRVALVTALIGCEGGESARGDALLPFSPLSGAWSLGRLVLTLEDAPLPEGEVVPSVRGAPLAVPELAGLFPPERAPAPPGDVEPDLAGASALFAPGEDAPPEDGPPTEGWDLAGAWPQGAVPQAPAVLFDFVDGVGARPQHAERLTQAAALSPTTAGSWRWLDDHALLFEPAAPFSRGTRYSASVGPVEGLDLPPVQSSFETLPPRLLQVGPDDQALPVLPLLPLVFDQPVEEALVLRASRLLAAGRPAGLTLATVQEIEADPAALQLHSSHPPGHVVVLRPSAALPPDAEVEVVVEGGVVGKQGHLPLAGPARARWRTRGPFELLSATCRALPPCPAGAPWVLEFSEPLAEGGELSRWVHVTPSPQELGLTIDGDRIVVRGLFTPGGRYRVDLEAEIAARSGLTLGRRIQVPVEVGPELADLRWSRPLPGRVQLPPEEPRLTVRSVGMDALTLTVNAIEARDYPLYLLYQQDLLQEGERPPLPGTPRYTTTLPVDGGGRSWQTTELDLSPALPTGRGQLLVQVEGSSRGHIPRKRVLLAQVEVSDLVLISQPGPTTLTVQAQRVRTGEGVADAALTLLPEGFSTRTDAQGEAQIPLPTRGEATPWEPPHLLVGVQGDNVSLIPLERAAAPPAPPEPEEEATPAASQPPDAGRRRLLLSPSREPWLPGREPLLTATVLDGAGAPEEGHPLSWSATLSPRDAVTQDSEGFTYGLTGERAPSPSHPVSHGGATDASGRHHVRASSPRDGLSAPALLTARVVSQRDPSLAAALTLPIEPAAVRVGLRPHQVTSLLGETLVVDVKVMTLAGWPDPGRKVALRVEPLPAEGGAPDPSPRTCRVISALEPAPCLFALERAGLWRLTATVVDGQGRRNTTALDHRVVGPELSIEPQVVALYPRGAYATPGRALRLIATAGKRGAFGRLSVSMGELEVGRRVAIPPGGGEIEIPLPREAAGPARVRLDVALQSGGPAVHTARLEIQAQAPPPDETPAAPPPSEEEPAPLDVDVRIPSRMSPGDQISLPVQLHNRSGAAQEVLVALELSLEGGAERQGRRITVPPNAQRVAYLPLRAGAGARLVGQVVVAPEGGTPRRVLVDVPVSTPQDPQVSYGWTRSRRVHTLSGRQGQRVDLGVSSTPRPWVAALVEHLRRQERLGAMAWEELLRGRQDAPSRILTLLQGEQRGDGGWASIPGQPRSAPSLWGPLLAAQALVEASPPSPHTSAVAERLWSWLRSLELRLGAAGVEGPGQEEARLAVALALAQRARLGEDVQEALGRAVDLSRPELLPLSQLAVLTPLLGGEGPEAARRASWLRLAQRRLDELTAAPEGPADLETAAAALLLGESLAPDAARREVLLSALGRALTEAGPARPGAALLTLRALAPLLWQEAPAGRVYLHDRWAHPGASSLLLPPRGIAPLVLEPEAPVFYAVTWHTPRAAQLRSPRLILEIQRQRGEAPTGPQAALEVGEALTLKSWVINHAALPACALEISLPPGVEMAGPAELRWADGAPLHGQPIAGPEGAWRIDVQELPAGLTRLDLPVRVLHGGNVRGPDLLLRSTTGQILASAAPSRWLIVARP